ncbi:MAG: YfiR family protein [Pseudomonadota bacterium]|nr:YfiR family protein [Pseudomonadota bacterium]
MRKLLLLHVLGSVLLAAGPVRAAPVDPNALKAAITLNLIRYIDIPDERGDGTIRLCVRRDLSAASQMARLNGRRLEKRTIAYRSIDDGAATGCDVVMLGEVGRSEVQRYRQKGRVIIGEGAGILDTGATIGLLRTGNQVRFEINLKAAREAGVTISSKILRLAARVQQ